MFKAAVIIALLFLEKPAQPYMAKIPVSFLTLALIAVALFILWTALQPGNQTRKVFTLAWMIFP